MAFTNEHGERLPVDDHARGEHTDLLKIIEAQSRCIALMMDDLCRKNGERDRWVESTLPVLDRAYDAIHRTFPDVFEHVTLPDGGDGLQIRRDAIEVLAKDAVELSEITPSLSMAASAQVCEATKIMYRAMKLIENDARRLLATYIDTAMTPSLLQEIEGVLSEKSAEIRRMKLDVPANVEFLKIGRTFDRFSVVVNKLTGELTILVHTKPLG